MEDYLHDPHEKIVKSYNQDDLSAFYEDVDNNMGPSKQRLTNFKVVEKNRAHQQESSKDQQKFKIKDNLNRESPKSIERSINIRDVSRVAVSDTSANAEYDDDDRDVVMRQLQNGCDNNFIDQKQEILILPDQLKNISLNQTSSDKILKENVPESSSTETRDAVNSTKSTERTIYTPTTSSSSEMILLCEQDHIRARDHEKWKSVKDINDQCVNQRLGEIGAKRGKNIPQYITKNVSRKAVQASTTNNYTSEISHQMPLNYAFQLPYLTVLPLHACSTFNHSHHNLLHIHHNHNHSNQLEYTNFANELTNALSSRLLFQISNHPSSSALKSQAKRQASFLKSQSLDIVQESPSIIYHETDDDDEKLFFQLPELNKDDVQCNHHHSEQHHQQSGPQQFYVEDRPRTPTRTTNTAQGMTNEAIAITRSLSLSSQKTGVDLKTQSLESRPIYPNVPYSPYASPYSSPRSNRRRPPLRESRRVSIEQTGSFLQLNQYKLMDQIGQGSYGLVKLAYSEEDSTHYAMKILSKRRLLRQAGLMKRGPRKTTSPLDRVYREIAVLKKLDHPNVVKLIEVLDDPLEDSLYMVFELVKQGEVLGVPTKNPLSEERAWSVFRDTILGLEYLHYQRIIHADIKPGNLLLTECGRVKIADLGVCNEFIGENATMTNGSTAGTPAFRAPESLNEGQNIYCGKAADIWALGATLYALVYGNVPFVESSVPALYEKIKVAELSFPENPKTSVELRNCIQSMLKKDPGDRLTLPQLKKHVWVTAGGLHPLPSEEENCRLVQVNDDDINSVVRSIPKLDTLILIKTMLKKHSFGNPFLRGISGRAPQRGGSRLERFIRAGRSNSAPGSCNMIVDRQLSGDNILPALCEHSAASCINEET